MRSALFFFLGDRLRGYAVPLSFFVVGSALLIEFTSCRASGGDWPGWRGPTRDGHSEESSGWISGSWPLEEPAWAAEVGEGCTSPVIVNGRLYTLGWKNDQDTVVCLHADTGAVIWKQSYNGPRYGRYHHGDEVAYSGPTGTPEFDSSTGFLYTLSADGDLHCWDTSLDGQRVWGMNLYAVYDVPQRPDVSPQLAEGVVSGVRDYGYVTAPLVYKDWLIVAVGAKEGHLMAFDKRDGRRVWVSDSTEPAGHCAGLAPIDVEGVPCVASFTLRKLLVIRLDDGKQGTTVAEYDWLTNYANNVASPTVHKNSVLLTSGYNREAICKVEIGLNGAKKLWESPYASGACTPVVLNNEVFWVWDRKMFCLDFNTGKKKWDGGNFGSPGSCIATADGKLIVWSDRGKLMLVEPGEKYNELSRSVRIFQAYCWPHVALANGRIYCKDRDGNIKCFTLKPIP